jgi:hypothetical protein
MLFDDTEEVAVSVKNSVESEAMKAMTGSNSSRPSSIPNRFEKTGGYAPLKKYFQDQPSSQQSVKLSFAEIEQILGRILPATSQKKESWWSNDGKEAQSKAWVDAGFRTTEHKFDDRNTEAWVQFERATSSREPIDETRNGPMFPWAIVNPEIREQPVAGSLSTVAWSDSTGEVR